MAKKKTIQPHGKGEKFTFETDEGVIELPFLENLPVGVIEDGAGMQVDEFFALAFKILLDDEAHQIRRAMTLHEYNTMVREWNEQSAIDMGELFA